MYIRWYRYFEQHSERLGTVRHDLCCPYNDTSVQPQLERRERRTQWEQLAEIPGEVNSYADRKVGLYHRPVTSGSSVE